MLPLRRCAPGFSKAIDVAPDAYTLQEQPTFSSQYGPAKNGGGGVYDATGEVDRGQFHLLFPGTTINVMPGRGNFSIGPIVPLGAERTYRFLDYFFLPGTDEQWIADYLELDTQVGAEDRVLVERVQIGMRSGMITEGALMPESERLIAHFERLLVDALGPTSRRSLARSRNLCPPARSPPSRASSTASCRGSSSTRACSTSRADEEQPLLERVKFCSIFSSNLDEFFMVRVAGLMGQEAAGFAVRFGGRDDAGCRHSPTSRHG